jgi:hypothetical protein
LFRFSRNDPDIGRYPVHNTANFKIDNKGYHLLGNGVAGVLPGRTLVDDIQLSDLDYDLPKLFFQ